MRSGGETRLDGNLYVFRDGCGLWNGISELTHAFQVPFDGFFHQLSGFFECCSRTDASREIWDMSAVSGCCWRIQYGVCHFFNPACFSIAARVPGSRSSEGRPAIVTIPSLEAW